MKNVNKIFSIVLVGFVAGVISCANPELPLSNLGGTNTPFTANFTFANATADAPDLDCYINGIKIGGTTGLGGSNAGYASVSITSSGFAGTATANTAVRVKSPTGATIIKPEGVSVIADLIYRSTNNGVNNFVAISGNSYTVFAIDSTRRPVAKRLFRVTPTIKLADITYFNPFTGKQISASRRDSIVAGTTVPPPATDEAANLLTIGLVPLGNTDPGGVRFYVVQDAFQPATALPTTSATQAAIRYVNAVANANGITAGANPSGVTRGGPPLFVRLRPAVGTTLFLPGPGSTNHVVTTASLNPTVGSRTATTTPPAVLAPNFPLFTIAVASVPINYTLEVATTAAYGATIVYSSAVDGVSFTPGRHYTVFVRGIAGKTGPQGVSHGIIAY